MKTNKYLKKAISALLIVSSAVSLTACTSPLKKDKEEAQVSNPEIQQNDYRGGIMRTKALKQLVENTINTCKEKNTSIRKDNPNSFWDSEGYKDFVSNFLSSSVINDTKWFNEEETSFDDIVQQLSKTENSFTTKRDDGTYALASQDIKITRVEKDEYTVTGRQSSFSKGKTSISGIMNCRALYDCNHDWCKAYMTLQPNNSDVLPNITTNIFEYARLDENTFAIQTADERLYIKLGGNTGDSIDKRPVEEFYYSRLDGKTATADFKSYVAANTIDSNGDYVQENYQKMDFTEENSFDTVYVMERQMPVEKILAGMKKIFADPSCGAVFRIKGFMQEENGSWIEVNATRHELKKQPIKEGQEILIVIGEGLQEAAIRKYLS